MCHSPLEVQPDGRLVIPAGLEFTGRSFAPEGATFVTAPNLTPDPETGIGTWTDDQIARAVREGISHDGRTLFPIMPYERFRDMSDEDLASIIVYLRSLKPVRHELPKTAIPFPVNRLINGLPEPITAPVQPDLSTPVKRGAYIAQMGVCQDCHTPRDDQGNVRTSMPFAGGTQMAFTGRPTVSAANITPAVNGITYYTEDLFIETMRTGKVHARQLDSMMPYAFFGRMSDADLKDLFAYLKSVQPIDHYVDNTLPPTPCPLCGLTHGGGERNKAK
jgi:mono/diheme cytochrome c family protein